jgi:hypothetical protein
MNEHQMNLFENEHAGERTTRTMLDQLLSRSKLYNTTRAFKDLMNFVVRLRNVAPFNTMLLQLQKPGLTYAASAYDWETRFQRLVKEDARPLLILWPFSPVALVYDVLDTFDPKNPKLQGLPENIASFFTVGEITSRQLQSFKALLSRKQIELVWVDSGDAHAGAIRLVDPSVDDKTKCYRLKLNGNHSPAVQFTTLAHELGHLFLGHLGPNKRLSIPKRRTTNHVEEEIEAESTAFIVCERNGVRTNSEAYMSQYVDAGIAASGLDLYQIMRAAGQVETLLGFTMHTRLPH